MPSFGRPLVLVALCAALLTVDLVAQQDAAGLYRAAMERETELRTELSAAAPSLTTDVLTRRVRVMVEGYEEIVRRFPRSGYSDNALWQAAVLSVDAFLKFGATADRSAATRLFARLTSEYPSSSLVRQVSTHSARLTAQRPGPAPPSGSTLRAIRREVLPDAIRVTLELEREASFYEERLDGPPRVFVDLYGTDTVEALKDAVLPYSDEVVKQIRVGRQPNVRTRVVLDLQNAGRHSVYALYNPYRIVIDIERRAVAMAVATPPPTRPAAPPPERVATPPVERPALPPSDTRAAATPERSAAPPAASRPAAPAAAVAPPPERSVAPPATNGAGGFSLSRQLGLGIGRIVIDPGHGGHDPGAQAGAMSEAEIVLDIALRLEALFAREPGVEVIMTRRTNVYVPLEERTAIANRASADLFLSIHANASANTSARGVETYFLNFAQNPAAEAVAARENAGSAQTMSNLPSIVRAIALNNKLDESRDFAGMVQAAMFERLRRADRNTRNLGVKQAPFMVLIGATMPSILTEISFITNRAEAALMRTQNHRQQIAEALYAGVMKYQQSLKRSAGVATR